MVTLEVAANPLELQIYEANILDAAGNMRSQAQDPGAWSRQLAKSDFVRVLSNDRASERQIGNLAGLELDEGRGEIVGPAAKRPTCVAGLSRPFHNLPKPKF